MSDPFQPPQREDFRAELIVGDKPHSSVDTEGGSVNNPPVKVPDNSPIDGGVPTKPPDINLPQSILEEKKISPTAESRATLSAPSNEAQDNVSPKQAEVIPGAENRTNAVTPPKETPADISDFTRMRQSGVDGPVPDVGAPGSKLERFLRDQAKRAVDGPVPDVGAPGSKLERFLRDQAKRAQKDNPESEVKIGDPLLYPYMGFPNLFEPEVFLPTYDIPDVMSREEWITQQPDDVGCHKACKKMVTNHGVTPRYIIPKTDKSRNVAKWTEEEEGKSLSPVQFSGNDNFGLPQSDYLRDLIDTELEQGKPVIVGVNRIPHHAPGSRVDVNKNANDATHHFVVIVGRSYDNKTGAISYHFFDPGPGNVKSGTSETNRLYVTPDFISGGRQGSGQFYVVTEIRSNQ
jgi:hypothetical protein